MTTGAMAIAASPVLTGLAPAATHYAVRKTRLAQDERVLRESLRVEEFETQVRSMLRDQLFKRAFSQEGFAIKIRLAARKPDDSPLSYSAIRASRSPEASMQTFEYQ